MKIVLIVNWTAQTVISQLRDCKMCAEAMTKVFHLANNYGFSVEASKLFPTVSQNM